MNPKFRVAKINPPHDRVGEGMDVGVLYCTDSSWALARDVLSVAQALGAGVSVPREVVAKKLSVEVGDIYKRLKELGIRLDENNTQTSWVRDDAWPIILEMHHVPQKTADWIVQELHLEGEAREVQPSEKKPPEYATKRQISELWKAFQYFERDMHARLTNLERREQAVASSDADQRPLDLKHLRKVLSEGWALLKQAESKEASQ